MARIRHFVSVARALVRESRTRDAVAAFAGDRSGAAAVTIALTFSLLVGMAALGTEVSDWYVIRRTMQGAADSAAYSAATAKGGGASSTAYTGEAKSVTASYNYVDGSHSVTVTVNSPPASGSHTGDANAVEVIIAQPQPLKLAGLFMASAPTLQARAVATLNASGSGCVLALERGNVTDMSDNGNTALNLNNCSLYVNSSSNSALTLNGGATINAYSAFIAGNYTTTGHAALNTAHGTFTGATPANDPYADVPTPSYSGCNQNSYSLTGNRSQTFSPGTSGVMVFCNGLSVSGGSSVTLQPGTYVIDGGSFSISGNSSISGTGVTIVLTSSSGSDYATAAIAGGATVSITAPTSGALSGLAFFQDRNAPSSGSDSFTGGATQNITGAVYFPHQSVTFNGGTDTGAAAICTQLVAYTITFNGNANFNNNCIAAGARGVGSSFIQLVE